MVAWARGYYGAPFKRFCGGGKGDPLSPTIFNVVVDAVLQHWIAVVEDTEGVLDPGAAAMEGFGQYVQSLEAYFMQNTGLSRCTGNPPSAGV